MNDYENELFVRKWEDRKQSVAEAVERFKRNKKLTLNEISEIAIELSNLCNYANLHKKCPANLVDKKTIIPSEIYYQIIDELAIYEWGGILEYQIYNEPTMDPRLFKFIEYAKKKCPKIKILLYSNGYYLNEVMMNEYRNIGIDYLICTGYGREEYDRLISLDKGLIPFRILYGALDDRLNAYEGNHVCTEGMCREVFYQLAIYSNGDVGYCCYDYKHLHPFGNVYRNKISEIINTTECRTFVENLLAGKREIFSPCRNCNMRR